MVWCTRPVAAGQVLRGSTAGTAAGTAAWCTSQQLPPCSDHPLFAQAFHIFRITIVGVYTCSKCSTVIAAKAGKDAQRMRGRGKRADQGKRETGRHRALVVQKR